MLFNSIDFALFLPIVFGLYWLFSSRSVRERNGFLILAGAFFYGWWDWRFLGLLVASAGVDYFVAIALGQDRSARQRKLLITFSVVVNIGLLFFFKYYDFFVKSFVEAFSFFGHDLDARPLGLVLPVGISFYTFQSLSYSIDVYRNKIQPERDPVTYFAFVSFFPQLLAGPIERAPNMLPQFNAPRVFNMAKASDGMRQILWGLFKKVVIADNCAAVVDPIFADHAAYPGSTLAFAIVLFAFQIYGDFSGYSDIAIGTARLLGFDLMRNFAFPYFSRNIPEFWRRWHISLSSWFRDYVYIPLGGSRGGKALAVRNTMIIFLVSGFWHGANWTYVVWGALNGLLFLPYLIRGTQKGMSDSVASGRMLPNFREVMAMLATFALACLAWTFFRADSVGQAWDILGRVLSPSLLDEPILGNLRPLRSGIIGIAVMLIVEWWSREWDHGLQIGTRLGPWQRRAFYFAVVFLIMGLAPISGGEFIYFQF